MAKNNKIDTNTIIIVVALLIFVIVVIPKLNIGGGFQFGSIVDPLSLFDNVPDSECIFEVDYELVCLGNNVTGTINAKSPNCYIGFNYNNEGWKFAGIINETSVGLYEESRQAPAVGHYEFAAICGTPADFCRTNNVEVDVINCDEPAPDITYTCGWIGEQCGGTCPSTHPLCVDVWFEEFALFGNGGYVECVCLNPDTEEVHPDWKPDGIYHDEPDYNGEAICTETDPTQNIHLFGICNSDSGIAEPDFCPTETAVTQLYC